jgi:putative Mg2+ transporter-C (MgtC) family protein
VPIHLTWQQIALRLILTLIAGAVLGINREEHGRAAGLRTTILVCLAASVAMIQTNLLLDLRGKGPDSFAVMDLMRLPLGILSGMGFIGAGAILRRPDSVHGVTTAATLWFTTILGLCFGGGQIGLGIATWAMGFGTLWGLQRLERRLQREHHATLNLCIEGKGFSDWEIRTQLYSQGIQIVSCSVTTLPREVRQEIHYEV